MSKLYPHQQALLDGARATGGSLQSISDDDACATCAHCVYQPGEQSSCTKGWPATPDADDYITECAQHEPTTSPHPGPPTMNPAFTLEDGEARNAANPDTFPIPRLIERQQVPVGHFAKLIFTKMHGYPPVPVSERMWVQVTHANDDGTYRGTVANGPVVVEAAYGDPLAFAPRHIIDITQGA